MEAQVSNQIIVIAIVVIAIAVVMQTISAMVSAMTALRMKAALDKARQEIEPLAVQAKELLGEARVAVRATNEQLQPILQSAARITVELQEITHKANDMASRGKAQAEQLDDALTETVDRVRVQMTNVEATVEHVLQNVRDTSSHVNTGIVTPIRKLNGLMNGVSTALGFLLQGRTTVQRATHEDEMFI